MPQYFDIGAVSGRLDTAADLETAVTISLLTWARANADDIQPSATDRKGWWGDTYADVPGDTTGSRIWTLVGLPMPQALERAEPIIRDALAWMLEDGLADRIELEVSSPRAQVLGAKVGIVRPGALVVTWVGTWDLTLSL
jgi:phage gp46-like protein